MKERDLDDLDSEMERDTEIRRDTQVRGSLGIPPSGNKSSEAESDEGVPEFNRERPENPAVDDDDRMSER